MSSRKIQSSSTARTSDFKPHTTQSFFKSTMVLATPSQDNKLREDGGKQKQKLCKKCESLVQGLSHETIHSTLAYSRCRCHRLFRYRVQKHTQIIKERGTITSETDTGEEGVSDMAYKDHRGRRERMSQTTFRGNLGGCKEERLEPCTHKEMVVSHLGSTTKSRLQDSSTNLTVPVTTQATTSSRRIKLASKFIASRNKIHNDDNDDDDDGDDNGEVSSEYPSLPRIGGILPTNKIIAVDTIRSSRAAVSLKKSVPKLPPIETMNLTSASSPCTPLSCEYVVACMHGFINGVKWCLTPVYI